MATHLLRAVPDDVDVVVTARTADPPGGVAAHRLDLRDAMATDSLVASLAPAVVIHTAYRQSDRADIVHATAHVAGACARHGAELVHLSTDAVFDGEHAPYAEGDPIAPIHDYGRWKAAAERVARDAVPDACVTRSSLVVSLHPPDSGTRWLLDSVRAGDRPTLFHDEVRSAIRASDLAAIIWALVALPRAERAGVWHLPGPEALSRAELGRRVLEASGEDPDSVRLGSVRDHPGPRPRDLTIVSHRATPGPAPSKVP